MTYIQLDSIDESVLQKISSGKIPYGSMIDIRLGDFILRLNDMGNRGQFRVLHIYD